VYFKNFNVNFGFWEGRGGGNNNEKF